MGLKVHWGVKADQWVIAGKNGGTGVRVFVRVAVRTISGWGSVGTGGYLGCNHR